MKLLIFLIVGFVLIGAAIALLIERGEHKLLHEIFTANPAA